jgi:AraC-like DNA-binding protein
MKIFYETKTEPIILRTTTRLSSLPHMHKEIEIIYVKKGASVAHADKQSCKITTGDVFISFPNQVHFYENTVTGSYHVMIISPKVFYGIKDMLYTNVPEQNSVSAHKKLAGFIKSFVESKLSDDLTACVGYINLIMSELLSKLALNPAIKSADGTLREVMDYCERHFTEDINLSVVSEHTHLSRCYVSHLFNAKLSIGFSDYINLLRVNSACDMLVETNKKIADISGDVGFGTIRSFNRAFLKFTNCTPQSYRDNHSSGLI